MSREIRSDEVNEVTRIEYHNLLTCPCRECEEERRRRRGHVVMKPGVARALGIIKSDRPNAGSVAREVANER